MKKEFEKITALLNDQRKDYLQENIISFLDQQGKAEPTLKSSVCYRG